MFLIIIFYLYNNILIKIKMNQNPHVCKVVVIGESGKCLTLLLILSSFKSLLSLNYSNKSKFIMYYIIKWVKISTIKFNKINFFLF